MKTQEKPHCSIAGSRKLNDLLSLFFVIPVTVTAVAAIALIVKLKRFRHANILRHRLQKLYT